MANPIDEAKELQQMLVTYAKQETVEPLKTLGSYLAWGIAGSIMMFLGALFGGLGTLRLLQSTVFDGSGAGTLVPYVAALGVLVVMMGLMFLAFQRAKKAIG